MASCSQLGLELTLWNANEDQSYQADKCIICQESRSCSVTTTEQGRRKVLEAAAVRRDIVYKHLQLVEENFVYQVSNECYKKYSLITFIAYLIQRKTTTTSTKINVFSV